MGLLLKSALGLAAEALCEKIRPTKTYSASWMQKVDDEPWARRGCKLYRRPWQESVKVPDWPPVRLLEHENELRVAEFCVAYDEPVRRTPKWQVRYTADTSWTPVYTVEVTP